MNTDEEAYKQFLEQKYRRGRTWYLEKLIFPRYFRELLPGNVYDLGCGFGAFLAYASKKSNPAIGVDNNPSLINHCKQQGLNVVLDSIIEPTQTYQPADNVVCDNVIEHLSIDQINLFFSNIPLFLKPGGRALFAVPNRQGFASDPTHKTFIDEEVLEPIAKNHGLFQHNSFLFPIPWQQLGALYVFNMTVIVFSFQESRHSPVL